MTRTASDAQVILDSALGTELSRWGLDTSAPLWSARVLGDEPEAVTEVHQDALRAGAQVLTANTFRTHERNLALAGWVGRSDELNARAIACAREAMVTEGRPATRVAGSLSPLEDCFRPDLVRSRDELRAEHGRQARSLQRAGADLILVETMGTRREAAAAVTAAVATGLPAWCSFTTSSPGRLLSGESLRDAVAAVEDLGAEAVLLNCIPAVEALPELEALLQCASVPVGIYPNIGHARPNIGHARPNIGHARPNIGHARLEQGFRLELLLSPDDFALRMEACAELGARFLGGCCGTQPEHLAAMTRALSRAPA